MLDKSLSRKHILFILSTFCGYILYAFFRGVFGTNAPVMMEHFDITSAEQGFIITMHSIGALVLAVYLALQGERLNKIRLTGVGIFFAGLSGAAIGFSPPYTLLLLLVLIAGAGYAILDIMSNSIVSELYPKQKSTIIPLLQGFFGTGSILAPIIVTTLVNPDIPGSYVRPFLLVGIAAIIVAVCYRITGENILSETPYADMDSIKKRVSENPAEIFKDKRAWFLLTAGFLYFSYLIGLVSWLPSYFIEIGMDFGTAGRLLTAFLIGQLLMRFGGALVLKWISAYKAYIILSSLSAAAIFAALLTPSITAMIPLLFIGGFMQGSCSAFLFLMAVEAFPQRTASASSLIIISVNTGSMTAPLWMGFVAEHTGYWLPLLLTCFLMALSVVFVSLNKKYS